MKRNTTFLISVYSKNLRWNWFYISTLRLLNPVKIRIRNKICEILFYLVITISEITGVTKLCCYLIIRNFVLFSLFNVILFEDLLELDFILSRKLRACVLSQVMTNEYISWHFSEVTHSAVVLRLREVLFLLSRWKSFYHIERSLFF